MRPLRYWHIVTISGDSKSTIIKSAGALDNPFAERFHTLYCTVNTAQYKDIYDTYAIQHAWEITRDEWIWLVKPIISMKDYPIEVVRRFFHYLRCEKCGFLTDVEFPKP